MAGVIKGTVRDIDGKTALKVQVNVVVKDSAGNQVGSAASSVATGIYSAAVSSTQPDNLVSVSYTRSGSANTVTVTGAISGQETQTIDPIVPS